MGGENTGRVTGSLKEYPDVLTVRETAEILRCDRRTVMAVIRRGELDARKIGRIYRILKRDVVDYLTGKA